MRSSITLLLVFIFSFTFLQAAEAVVICEYIEPPMDTDVDLSSSPPKKLKFYQVQCTSDTGNLTGISSPVDLFDVTVSLLFTDDTTAEFNSAYTSAFNTAKSNLGLLYTVNRLLYQPPNVVNNP